MVRVVSTLLFLLCTLGAQAQFQSVVVYGSELSWQCLGQGKYQFTAVVYTGCQNDLTFQSHNLVGPALGTFYPMHIDTANTGNVNNCGTCDQKRWIIKTDTISLTGTPPSTGWTFVYQRCCRANTQNFASASVIGPIHLSTTLYPYTPPGSANTLPLDSC